VVVSNIFICGTGAVSPAGWGMALFREALTRGEPLPTKELARPGWTQPLRIRQVPAPNPRPSYMAHARLRRTSPIAQYAVGAALEALGGDAAKCADGKFRLGIIFCAMSGCVNYSRRFYDEVLKDPATASPLVFPETVFNSPASHLAALLGTTGINYTLVGDPGTFVSGIALAADWLMDERVDGCLVVGADEMDWLTADAMRLFEHSTIVSDGAGALYLKREPSGNLNVRLHAITSPHLFCRRKSRAVAIAAARVELASVGRNELLCDGLMGNHRADHEEQSAWQNWAGPRLSAKKILGEGLTAAAAWQCVAAVDALQQNQYDAATVSVAGCNEQAIAAQFVRCSGAL
jgi:3-oxoacyl-(acyl-carrier-protein) synthase